MVQNLKDCNNEMIIIHVQVFLQEELEAKKYLNDNTGGTTCLNPRLPVQ